jgi:hypothetical protein
MTTAINKHTYYGEVQGHILQSLDDYAEKGWEPGGFLVACLCNDLMGAVARADDRNVRVLRDIALYIHNELPSPCHGSPEHVAAWLKKHAELRKVTHD